MINNVKEILREVASTSKDLAGILDDILKGIDGINDKSDLPTVINESIDNFTDNMGRINMIPGEPGGCHQLCISKAFGKWGANNGFKNIASQTITYWLSCAKINRFTIIFTSAWDELDFNQRFRNKFNAQSSDPNKNICVILTTSQGVSILYLR